METEKQKSHIWRLFFCFKIKTDQRENEVFDFVVFLLWYLDKFWECCRGESKIQFLPVLLGYSNTPPPTRNRPNPAPTI